MATISDPNGTYGITTNGMLGQLVLAVDPTGQLVNSSLVLSTGGPSNPIHGTYDRSTGEINFSEIVNFPLISSFSIRFHGYAWSDSILLGGPGIAMAGTYSRLNRVLGELSGIAHFVYQEHGWFASTN